MAASGLQRLAEQLWHQLSQWLWPAELSRSVQQPILSQQQITELANEVAQLSMTLPANPHGSEALRQGEQVSRFMGSGLEYEESRPYQMGDEIRRINWRLMAKTGQAYTKLYQEERQENWFIVLDQRQTMRFGTRKRLKAEQAVRVAGYYIWMAQQSAIPVEGARLAEQVEFTPTFEGRSSFEQLMAYFSLPCPPIEQAAIEPHLNDLLLDITHRVQPGSRIILISDFHDLNQQSVEILTALQQLADVQAVWIRDAAEQALPNQPGVQLQSMVDGQCYTLNDSQQLQSYQAWSDQYFKQQQIRLKMAGVSISTIMSHADLSQLQARSAYE